jgi:hypothetical protein
MARPGADQGRPRAGGSPSSAGEVRTRGGDRALASGDPNDPEFMQAPHGGGWRLCWRTARIHEVYTVLTVASRPGCSGGRGLMGVQILHDREQGMACLYDSVSEGAFGPVLDGTEAMFAEAFVEYVTEQTGLDPRDVPGNKLMGLRERWRDDLTARLAGEAA